jgi:KRAB domain-containing zinc finger protein
MVYTAEGVRYKCTQCPRLLKKMAHVKIHMKIHEKNLKCVKCGKMFYYEKKLEDHVDNQYQCSMCQNCIFKFVASINFLPHIWHKYRLSLLCRRMCILSPVVFLNLSLHILHSNGFTPVCMLTDVCGKKFLTKHFLQIHSIVHTKVKKFVCDICGNKFGQKAALYRHKKFVH